MERGPREGDRPPRPRSSAANVWLAWPPPRACFSPVAGSGLSVHLPHMALGQRSPVCSGSASPPPPTVSGESGLVVKLTCEAFSGLKSLGSERRWG